MKTNHIPCIQIVNPARAGMIPASADAVTVAASKPRASGDDPRTATPYT